MIRTDLRMVMGGRSARKVSRVRDPAPTSAPRCVPNRSFSGWARCRPGVRLLDRCDSDIRVEVLFACDLERERRAVVESGSALSVDMVASSVRGIAASLEGAASER